MIKAGLLEMLGCTAITFFMSLSRIKNEEDYLTIGLTAFFLYTAFIYAFKGVSGGFFNPIVLLSLTLTKQTTLPKFVILSFFQIVGSVIGAFLLSIFRVWKAEEDSFYGEPRISDKYKYLGAVLEGFFMFSLVFVYNCVMSSPKAAKHISGPLFGGVYLFGITASGLVSRGCGNVVHLVGPSIFSGNFGDWVYYFGGQIGGGLISSLIFEFFLKRKPEDDEDEVNELEQKEKIN